MYTATYKSNLGSFLNKYNKNKLVALAEMGKYGQLTIKDETPVLSGKLQKSVSYKVENEDLYFYSLLPYAPYVEFGTFVMAANSFMKRGIYKSNTAFLGIMLRNFKL